MSSAVFYTVGRVLIMGDSFSFQYFLLQNVLLHM